MKNVIQIGDISREEMLKFMIDKVNKILVIPDEKDIPKIKSESFIFPIPVLVYNYIEKPNIDISDYTILIIKSDNDISLEILKKHTFEQVFITIPSESIENYLKENYNKNKDHFIKRKLT